MSRSMKHVLQQLITPSARMMLVRWIFTLTILHSVVSNFLEPAVSIEQSAPCTPEESLRQIQCLRELPAESYEVLEGEDVQMRCRVAHQRGKVQWRAGNFLLGYIRAIPSRPRYSIQGDPRLGIHDLLIRNVTNDDAGTFECQVSPAENQAALRRVTTLSILVQPSQPIILGASGEAQPTINGQLVVPISNPNTSGPNSQGQLRLFCQVRGGIPPPKFEWFHNGLPVTGSSITSSSNYHEDGYTVLPEAAFDQGLNQRSTTEVYTTELVLDKAKLKTGDRLACLVSNKATLRSNQLSKQKLRSELFVVIHSPPGDPQLISPPRQGNHSSVYDTGATLEVTCRAMPAGNPPGEIVWRMERVRQWEPDDRKMSFAPTGKSVRELEHNMYLIPAEHVVHQYTEEKLLSKVRIPNLNANHHGIDLVCAVKNQAGPEKVARMTILVRHRPSSVKMYGPEETIAKLKQNISGRLTTDILAELDQTKTDPTLIYVHKDRPQYLLCLTSAYFDKASIKWYGFINDLHYWQEIPPVETFHIMLEDIKASFILASFAQLITTNSEPVSVLKWTAVKCVSEAVETVAETSNSSVDQLTKLEAYEPPGKPTLNGSAETSLLFEGQNFTLECTAFAGTPKGEIKWITSHSRTDEENRAEFKTMTEQKPNNQMVSRLTLTVTKSINGMHVRCASLNAGYKLSEQRKSFPVILTVAFAASSINMSVIDESGGPLPSQNGPSNSAKPKRDSPLHLDTSKTPKTLTTEMGAILSVACEVDSSNPPSKIYWRLHRCPKVVTVQTFKFKHTKSEECSSLQLAGWEDVDNNRLSVRSLIRLPVNWTHHGNSIECYARPDIKADAILTKENESFGEHLFKVLSESLQLNVLFKPIFPTNHLQRSTELTEAETSDVLQVTTVEGGSIKLDMDPIANPHAQKFVWFKNDKQIIIDDSRTTNSASGSDEMHSSRVKFLKGKMYIKPVQIEDMGNYSLLAVNTIGTSQLHFFLNVTYGPRLIGNPSVNITATGQKAVLECEAQANPPPAETAVRWRRLPYALTGIDTINHFYKQTGAAGDTHTKQHELQASSVSGIRCNKGKWHSGFKYFVKCWRTSENVLSSSLTIYNLGPSDVGRYQCYMDNAIGSPAVRIIDLLYPFAPKIIFLPRWLRAAPTVNLQTPNEHDHLSDSANNNGLNEVHQARLTCVVGAEPIPRVEWIREPANLTLVEGGQFQSEVKTIQPGLYHAILYLNRPREADLGRYYCKVVNEVGQDVGKVDLIEPSKPELPNMPRLVNTTSTSIAVRWNQAFNGGPKQKFQLRWAPNEYPDLYKQTEIEEDMETETLTYNIHGLQKATTYRVAVSASNHLMGSTGFTPYLLASTKAHDPIPDKEAMRDEAGSKSLTGARAHQWDFVDELSGDSASFDRITETDTSGVRIGDRTSVLIVCASIFGSLVLFANLLIILLLAHRKRRKLSRGRGHTLFNGHEPMISRSRRQSFNDIIDEQRPTYTAYLDGASLSDNLYIPTRSTDQYSAFHSGFAGPVVATDASNLLSANQSYNESPCPNLQAMNHLEVQTQNHMEFSPSTQLANRNITDPEMSGITYINSDISPHVVDFQGHPLLQIRNTGSERRTPISGRVNVNLGIYPAPHQIESPNSATASVISAARSAGYPNTHSLERKGYFLAPRQPSQHNISSLIRQPRYVHYTTHDAVDRNASDYILRNQTSTFTPNHTEANGRLRVNPMVSSVYADRAVHTGLVVCGDNRLYDGLNTGMGAFQLMKKGSYKSRKNSDASNRMNTSQLLDTYLQRYDDGLFGCQTATDNSVLGCNETVIDGAYSPTRNYGPSSRLLSEAQHRAESIVLPPPNRFASHANNQYFPNITQGIGTQLPNPPLRPTYHGSDDEPDEDERNHLLTEIDRRETGIAIAAPVKHPTPNQSLLYQPHEQNNCPRYGCML